MSRALLMAIFLCKKEIPAIEKKKTAKVIMKSGGQYSYKYADLPDVQMAIKGPLENQGLIFVHNIVSENGKELLKTRLIHVETGEEECSTLEIPQGQFQERGASITYGKRYSIGALLDLVLDEDIDGPPKIESETGAKQQKTQAQQNEMQKNSLMTVPQGKRLWAISKKHGWDQERIKQFMMARFQIESTKELTRLNYDLLISAIEKSPVVEDNNQK